MELQKRTNIDNISIEKVLFVVLFFLTRENQQYKISVTVLTSISKILTYNMLLTYQIIFLIITFYRTFCLVSDHYIWITVKYVHKSVRNNTYADND